MSYCNDVREELKAFADGELGTEERTAIRGHLDGCPDCRRELALIQRLGSELRSLEEAVPRPELKTRILDSLPYDPFESNKAVIIPRAPWWRINWPFMTLGTAAAAFILILLVLPRQQPPPLLPPAGYDPSKSVLGESERKLLARNDSSADKSLPDRKAIEQPATASGPRALKEGPPLAAGHALTSGSPASSSVQPHAPTVGPTIAAKPGENMVVSEGVRRGGELKSGSGGAVETKAVDSAAVTAPAGPAAKSDGTKRDQDVALDYSRNSKFGREAGKQADLLADKEKKDSLLALRTPELKSYGIDNSTVNQPERHEFYVLDVEELEKGAAQVVSVARGEGGIVSPMSDQGVQGAHFVTAIVPKERVEAVKAKLSKLGLNLQYESLDKYGVALNRSLANGAANLNSAIGDEKSQGLGANALGAQRPEGRGAFGGGGLGGGVGGYGGKPGGVQDLAANQRENSKQSKGAAGPPADYRGAQKRSESRVKEPESQAHSNLRKKVEATSQQSQQSPANQQQATQSQLGQRFYENNAKKQAELDSGRGRQELGRANIFAYSVPPQMTKLIIQLRETPKSAPAGKK